MERILVTAANGKVGHRLVHELAERGLQIRAGVHSPERAEGRFDDSVEIVALDFENPRSLTTALEGIDSVALITPPAREQVEYATRFIDLAKEAGVRRIVRLSVLAAAMEPGIQLGRWHRVVERYLQASGLQWSIVRPGPFFQNLVGMYGAKDGNFALPAAEAPVNHIDVADVALAMAEILDCEAHDGQVHMITGTGPLSFSEIARRLSQGSGREYAYTAVEPEAAHVAFSQQLPDWLATILSELFAAFRTGAVGMKTSTFEELTGRAPRTIDDFARELAQQAQAQLAS